MNGLSRKISGCLTNSLRSMSLFNFNSETLIEAITHSTEKTTASSNFESRYFSQVKSQDFKVESLTIMKKVPSNISQKFCSSKEFAMYSIANKFFLIFLKNEENSMPLKIILPQEVFKSILLQSGMDDNIPQEFNRLQRVVYCIIMLASIGAVVACTFLICRVNASLPICKQAYNKRK